MANGRRPTRHSVSLFIGTGDDGGVPFGRARDLSVTGVFLETDARPPLGSVHAVSLVWGDDTVVCPACVIRHATDGIGLAFVNPDMAFCQVVREILEGSPILKTPAGQD
ncbi:MAG: PilZ domain-containing protein [Myxococcota bacterium]